MLYKKNINHFIKNGICFTAILLISLSFLSCNKNVKSSAEKNLNSNSENKTLITATFYPLYIMLLNITDGAENVELSLLAPPNTGCLHDYQLTTKDMRSIEKCNILVANGCGMEDFIDKALSIKKENLILAGENFAAFKSTDENPHIWVSLAGAVHEIKNITKGLCLLNPENTELYKKNSQAYISKIEELSLQMHSDLDKFAGTKIITFHEAFPYFASEFNLEIVAVMENEEGEEPTAKELNQLIKIINESISNKEKIALFGEENFSSSAAEILSRETGVSLGILDPAVTGALTKDSYLLAMKKNLEVLKEYLK